MKFFYYSSPFLGLRENTEVVTFSLEIHFRHNELILCITLFYFIICRSSNSAVTKIEIEGVPPIAIEALMEYCYKDR